MLLFLATLVLTQDVGVQKVVAAIAEAAQENAARPVQERAAGDELTDLFARRACSSGQPAKSIVLGMAYALEPSGIIARYPFAGSIFEDVETDVDRTARLAAMGSPTLRGRQDWLAHFVVSAGLLVMIGERAAETVGIQKEVFDAAGKQNGAGTGFSFTDLNANLAGIAFARWLTGADSTRAVAACGKAFHGADFHPDAKDLVDGYTLTEFEVAWGGVHGDRFKAEVQRLRKRVAECKGYEPD